jgi:hypothetical protein
VQNLGDLGLYILALWWEKRHWVELGITIVRALYTLYCGNDTIDDIKMLLDNAIFA